MKKREFVPASANDNLERFFEKMGKRELEKKELLSSHDYILWLEKFTSQYESFSDESWLYRPEEISESDSKNVEKLELFLEILSEYCHKYYIDTTSHEMYVAECINIKHNGIGYQVALVVGQGGYVCVKRKVPEDGAIEFDDVLNDTMPEGFEDKKALLTKFEQIVTELKTKKVPTSILMGIVNK